MEQNAEKAIEVKNVKKIYRMGSERICAVDGVSFDIMKGEFCCLLGTSGSGKSTLLNLMAGIEKLTGGEIIIKGRKIHKMSENSLARFRQRYLGFVFQSYNLIGSMTALENVEFPLVFKKVPGRKRKKMAREMLIKVGLKTRLKHRPKEMSGGQQQRVGIARAFVAKPEIVFADEPTGNLDTRTTMEVMGLIKTIARENNQTIVMVTHDPRLAAFADKIIHILDGKIQNIEIVEHPKQAYTEEEVRAESAAGKEEPAASQETEPNTAQEKPAEAAALESKPEENEEVSVQQEKTVEKGMPSQKKQKKLHQQKVPKAPEVLKQSEPADKTADGAEKDEAVNSQELSSQPEIKAQEAEAAKDSETKDSSEKKQENKE